MIVRIIILVRLLSLLSCFSLSHSLATDVASLILRQAKLALNIFPSTGRGVQTLVDRPENEHLLKVPLNETVTSSFLEKSTLVEQFSEEQKLAVTLLHLKNNQHPYVSSVLPKKFFGVWSISQEEWAGQPFSQLPRCYRETLQASRNMAFDFSSSMIDEYPMEETLWALSMVRSRSIAVPELADFDGHVPLALIPGLDLFNHQFDSGTVLELTPDQHWTLTSRKSYAAGDQIFLSYGDDKDNWKLLLTYGFAVPNNPNQVAFWTWEDLLDAASTVRPGMFSERVRRSLLMHPQLQLYVSLSEERATFSLDTKTKVPRESLRNGLTMLSSLATQLGFPHDDLLERDVLNCLIEKRKEELRKSLKVFENKLQDTKGDWLPFLSSLELNLNEELSLLSA